MGVPSSRCLKTYLSTKGRPKHRSHVVASNAKSGGGLRGHCLVSNCLVLAGPTVGRSISMTVFSSALSSLAFVTGGSCKKSPQITSCVCLIELATVVNARIPTCMPPKGSSFSLTCRAIYSYFTIELLQHTWNGGNTNLSNNSLGIIETVMTLISLKRAFRECSLLSSISSTSQRLHRSAAGGGWLVGESYSKLASTTSSSAEARQRIFATNDWAASLPSPMPAHE